MNRPERVVSVPWGVTALFVWVFGHGIVLLDDFVIEVIVDSKVITDILDVFHRNTTQSEYLVTPKERSSRSSG